MAERDRGLSVTLKAQGKDRPWLVFTGKPQDIAEDIAQTLGYDSEDIDGLTVAQLVLKAQKEFEGMDAVSQGLDAVPIPGFSGGRKAGGSWKSAYEKAEAKPEPESKPEHETVLEQIEAIEVPESAGEARELANKLKLIGSQHRAILEAHPEVKAAYSAKGKSLVAVT